MRKWFRFISTLLVLVFIAVNAGAQTTTPPRRVSERKIGTLGGSVMIDPGRVMVPKTDVNSKPVQNDKYDDARLKELEQQLQDRSWNSESTAWQTATKLGTKEAYQKYVAMYPYGAHAPEATKILIRLEIEHIFNYPHNSLPGMKHTKTDENSEVSTVVIENRTGVRLHVLYSNDEDGKELFISPDGKAVITVKNCQLRMAASVDDTRVRPFAGIGDLEGGEYEISFYIVQGGPDYPSNGWMRRTN